MEIELLGNKAKALLLLKGGGSLRGDGNIQSFSLCANFEKYPNGLCGHYNGLSKEEQEKFVIELAEEFGRFDEAMKHAVPYVEFPDEL